ncbi:MucR family transcriptional regulator [Aerobium aerolatum]|uniref:MucR family transcriptional regulator n=1 Tax=Aerobium aerolatum TaxID=561088 RepID=UPI000B80BA31|nr:MucR family transcriptional regulator [Aquamicrobium aerolatum]
MSSPEKNTDDHLELMGKIVSAYVANNAVPAADLTRLMSDVHSTIALLSRGEHEIDKPEASQDQPIPAVSVKKSVQHDHLVCLEDGKKFKSLKRHLEAQHNMTPDEYRAKWNLPDDYPMIAPGYSEIRSRVAKEMGLGRTARSRRGPYTKRVGKIKE